LHTYCLLKHVSQEKIEGIIKVMGRRRKRSKQLVDTVKEREGYWKLKGEALDCTLWKFALEEAMDCRKGMDE